MKRRHRIALTFCLMLTAVACKRLDLIPENNFTDLNYWTTEEKVKSILNTAYSQMGNSERFFSNEGMSDNAFSGRGDFGGSTSLAAGTYDPALGRILDEWRYHYQGIKTCNLILQNIDQVPMNEDVKARMKAETRFIRALKHFQLTTWFGAVPLLDQDPSLEEALHISRTPKGQVVEYILNELDAAAQHLPINTAYGAADRGRITKGAALALKARVYLYEGRWQDVVNTCESLMNGANGNYALFPSYEGLFLPENENNNEVILDMQYVPEFRTWSNFFDFAPLSVGARLNNLAPTQELVDSYIMLNGKRIDEEGSGYDEDNAYENRDPRMASTVVYDQYQWRRPDGSVQTIYIKPGTAPSSGNASADEYAPGTASSPTGYYWRKYYDPSHGNNFLSGLNLILIRYADILLMYAEAKNELVKLGQEDWDLTVRAIRTRAGFTQAEALNYRADLSQEGLRDLIRNERRSEFAFEGTRIFDIRRWRIAEQVLNGWAHGAKFGPANEDNGYIRANLRTFDSNKHYLWPIPRDERNLNSNLEQNPGWEN
ncbi:RagB/SusD family nutrient uptake outer membrane protein [Olivibacter sitiensis]|uniref:RagB/SusD family nutrient uptake outer membrane protein n=1 Tax=Olivibacter sitiensis TaxID=376470 RepID=UPI0004133B01|nr:RagB/SusD family nutrient uptake outer membrane protein [Olivibacter sitiensis]